MKRTITELARLVADLRISERQWRKQWHTAAKTLCDVSFERDEYACENERLRRAVKKARSTLSSQTQRRVFDMVFAKTMGVSNGK